VTSPPVVAPIVEGHGEVKAVQVLVSRIGLELLDGTYIEVAQPFRLDSGKMRKPDELAKAIRFQAQRVPGRGGVLVLRDGDDGDVTCPVTLASSMKPAQEAVPAIVEVVIAWREYEAWLLAAVDSLNDHPAVRDDAHAPANPEGSRGAKGRLESLMLESYKETLHQAKFSAQIDLKMAQANNRSFRRMVHAVEVLVRS
jgi:Domain of unknown function (DUF4276)